MNPSTWMVNVCDRGVKLMRIHDGQMVEDYPIVSHAKGAIYLAAIGQGFEPPRCLRECDKRPLQTPPEC